MRTSNDVCAIHEPGALGVRTDGLDLEDGRLRA